MTTTNKLIEVMNGVIKNLEYTIKNISCDEAHAEFSVHHPDGHKKKIYSISDENLVQGMLEVARAMVIEGEKSKGETYEDLEDEGSVDLYDYYNAGLDAGRSDGKNYARQSQLDTIAEAEEAIKGKE
jgi:uncharacterized protein YqfA (UPF0365 family)